jgi:hypothetical protein
MYFLQGREYVLLRQMLEHMRAIDLRATSIGERLQIAYVADKVDVGACLGIKYFPSLLGLLAADMKVDGSVE